MKLNASTDTMFEMMSKSFPGFSVHDKVELKSLTKTVTGTITKTIAMTRGVTIMRPSTYGA
jgi:hypothetical protein